MLRSNSKSLGNPCSQSRKRKKRLQWEGFAESFKPGMKELVGDGKLYNIRFLLFSFSVFPLLSYWFRAAD